MKFICLGYIEPNKFETMPEAQWNALADECFSYDDTLRKNGNFAGVKLCKARIPRKR